MKRPTREDERKLFEAYEVLDKLCNNHNLINDLCREKINKFVDEVSSKLAHVAFEIAAMKRANYLDLTRIQISLDKFLEETKNKYFDEI